MLISRRRLAPKCSSYQVSFPSLEVILPFGQWILHPFKNLYFGSLRQSFFARLNYLPSLSELKYFRVHDRSATSRRRSSCTYQLYISTENACILLWFFYYYYYSKYLFFAYTRIWCYPGDVSAACLFCRAALWENFKRFLSSRNLFLNLKSRIGRFACNLILSCRKSEAPWFVVNTVQRVTFFREVLTRPRVSSGIGESIPCDKTERNINAHELANYFGFARNR